MPLAFIKWTLNYGPDPADAHEAGGKISFCLGFRTVDMGPRDLSSRRGKYVGQMFDHRVDLVARRCAPEAETDGTHAHLGRDIHRFQNRR